LFELLFIWVAMQAKPAAKDMMDGFINIPWSNKSYLYMVSSNIGAVIMPWMIFFQQSAVLDKGLNIEHIKPARWDTAIGAVITQIVMCSLLIITAATIGKTNPNTPLATVTEISDAITPILGFTTGRVIFALGMSGAALVATIVISLTAAWGVGEVTGFKRSLDHYPKEAPWFYGIYTVTLILGAVLVSSDVVNLVNLSIAVEVMNAMLLPIVLGFLYMLARRALPAAYCLKGWYGFLTAVVIALTSGFGFVTALLGTW
jgi:Mn2+/Fe2+ NRAMP family transporter